MDERPTDRTVTLVVPLPNQSGRPAAAPYVERRTVRPSERETVRPETGRAPVREPRPVEPVRPTVRPDTERLHWQTVQPPVGRPVRELPNDGGRTHLKLAAAAVPVTAVAGAVCGLVSSLWPLAVVAGAAAAWALLVALTRVARWLTDSIAGEGQ